MAKFKYVGEEPVGVYQGHYVKKGDVIELDDVYSAKALANPSCNLVEVKDTAKVTSLSAEEEAAQAAAEEAEKAEKAAKHKKK
jgi:hypothetical protein